MFKLATISLILLSGFVSSSLVAQDRGREDRGREDRGRFERGRGGDRGGGDRGRGGERSFDPSQFVDRMDRNENGYLDANEISGRSRGWIERMGFDASKPISLESIKLKIKSERERKQYEDRKQQRDASRQVPKFGEPIDWPPVADFAIEGGSATDNEEQDYDEEIMSQVNRIIERYDRNRDRVLDAEENSRLRWESLGVDLNGDKKYTVQEIAEFYKRRTQEARARDSSDRNDRRVVSTRGQTITTRTIPMKTTNRPVVVSKPTPSLDVRFNSYVDNIMKKYDKNGDGVLNRDEMKEVRVPFKDEDGNGEISRDEALAYVGGKNKSSSPSTPQTTSNNVRNGGRSNGPRNASIPSTRSRSNSGSTSVRREISGWQRIGGQSASRAGSRRRSAPERFNNYDANQDGQIQMSEFAKPNEWTDAKLSEFDRLDGNGDGVITSKEWSNSSGRD